MMLRGHIVLIVLVGLILQSLASSIIHDDQADRTPEGERDDEEIDIYGNSLQDWSFYNYSSKKEYARNSIVRWGGKIYDPLSFKGGENDVYALAYHLSTEVAVSAAQSRNGTLFEVAKVDGDESYKALMSHIQQDIKGDRSVYYAEPDLYYGRDLGLLAYPAYVKRLYRYLRHGPPPAPANNPTLIFRSILSSLQIATEEALGAKLNRSEGFYDQGRIYMRVSAPWELNQTYSRYMRHAMNSLNMSSHYGHYELEQRPWMDWYNHSNDVVDYSGGDGTRLAFEQAKAGVEMMEYDPYYRYGDFICGTPMVEEAMRVEEEMKASGTWAEPPRKQSLDWDCRSWSQCWRAWPWKWNYIDLDREDI